MISIDNSVWNMLRDAPNAYTIKIFFYIATHQPQDGICGFIISKLQLQIDLKENRTNIFRAIKWLKDNSLIQELKQVESSEFMATPRWVMHNSDFNDRKTEWDRRCRLDIERDIRLKRERRLRKLRNSNKQ